MNQDSNLLFRLLVGIHVPPAWVGFTRGLLEGAVIAAVGAVVIFVAGYDYTVIGLPPMLTAIIPGLVWNGGRFIEALLDQYIDPTQNRRNLPPRAP